VTDVAVADVSRARAVTGLGLRAERLLLLAIFITSLGNSIQLTAASIVTLRTEGSAVAVGWLFVAFSAPPVLLSFYFGRLADRFDRRTLCIVSDLGSTVIAIGLPVWLLLGLRADAGLYAATFGLAAMGALFLPASNALIKERVAENRLGPFNANFEMAFQAGTLLSTGIGGWFVQLFGARPLFFFNGATFVASILCFLAMGRRPTSLPAPEEATIVDAGVEPPAATSRLPIGLAVLYALGNPVITVSNTLLVVLVIGTFREGAGILGVVDALAGIGFFASAVLYKRLIRRVPDLRIALVGYLASAAFITLEPQFGVIALMFLLPGGTITFGVARVACRTMLMRAIHESRAGRVFGAANAFGLSLSIVATIAIAEIVDRTHARWGFVALAVLMVAVAVPTAALVSRAQQAAPDLSRVVGARRRWSPSEKGE
jgi:MFS family permease